MNLGRAHDAPGHALAAARARDHARGERGHGAHGMWRRREPPARALVGGRGQPLTSDPEGGAFVAEEWSESAGARPPPARVATERDGAGPREHEHAALGAERRVPRGLDVGHDVDTPREPCETPA